MSQTFRKIHDYLVGEEIARGSFSSIRIAYHNSTFQEYAFKIISKRKISQKLHGINIYFGECKLAPLLDHPNIIKIHKIIDSQHSLFQIMDFCEEGDILTYIYEHKVSNSFLFHLIEQVFSAIDFLHSNGLCHRDIKPENLLLGNDMSVKLTDFDFLAFSNGVSNCGKCGSFGYAAPEIFSGCKYDGRAADIWSLGVLIYSLFTKTCPFKDKTSNGYNPEQLSYESIPDDFRDLVRSMLQIDPNCRPTIKQLIHHFSMQPVIVSIPLKYKNPNFIVLLTMSIIQERSILDITQKLPDSIRERTLYHLVEQKMQNIGLLHVDELLPHKTTYAQSLPVSGESVSISDNDDFLVLGSFSFSSELYKIISTLNNFLLKQNCTISLEPNIKFRVVLNQVPDDAIVELDYQDSTSEKTKIEIKYNAPAVDLCKELQSFLTKELIPC